MRLLLSIAFVALTVGYVAAQKNKIKFGGVTKDELQLTKCAFYPDADAMVLARYGELGFEYSRENGWKYHIDITERLKIFTDRGKERADVSISLYDPIKGTAKEDIGVIKAYTYNLRDGQVVKSRLEKEQVFETRLNDYRVKVTFTMPDVAESSVIEYKYRITSDYISTLYTWYFQDDIPIQSSSMSYRIPEFFNYRESQVGAVVKVNREVINVSENFQIYWREEVGANSRRARSGTQNLQSNSTLYRINAQNVLPVVDEPYMNNRVDVPSRVEFQLISTKMPGSNLRQIARSYEDFSSTIMDWSSFGGAIGKGAFARDKIATLDGDASEMAIGLYDWINDEIAFNNVYGVTGAKAGRKALTDKEGSTGDINLTLVAAMREAGLQAFPVILSTRGHGIPHPVYPNFEDFNYVIVAVVLGEKIQLADATADLPFGFLPRRCLNGQGWLVTEDGGTWVDLKKNARAVTTVASNFGFEEGQLHVKHQVRYEGYKALEEKSALSSKGEEDYRETLMSSFDEEVDDVTLENGDRDLRWNVDYTSEAEDAEYIYIQPVQLGTVRENPFTREERLSPVDYTYTSVFRVIAQVQIPEGYALAEKPEPAVIALPEKGGRFTYAIQQSGNTVSISSVVSLSKTDYSSMEYPYLKQFYQMVAEKHDEIIVLKKI